MCIIPGAAKAGASSATLARMAVNVGLLDFWIEQIVAKSPAIAAPIAYSLLLYSQIQVILKQSTRASLFAYPLLALFA